MSDYRLRQGHHDLRNLWEHHIDEPPASKSGHGVGRVDSAELAAEICDAVNAAREAGEAGEAGEEAPTAQAESPDGVLMTPQQLSEYLEVPTQTLSNWRWRNEGPKWSKAGRHVRYRLADVERWLDSQQGGGAA